MVPEADGRALLGLCTCDLSVLMGLECFLVFTGSCLILCIINWFLAGALVVYIEQAYPWYSSPLEPEKP